MCHWQTCFFFLLLFPLSASTAEDKVFLYNSWFGVSCNTLPWLQSWGTLLLLSISSPSLCVCYMEEMLRCLPPCNWFRKKIEIKCRILKKLFRLFFRCVCAEPYNPSNETLELWKRKNVTAYSISWGNLTVSVSILGTGKYLRSMGSWFLYLPVLF